jgi:DNA invertase Pin-like site-specific DNA recombinase
LVAEFRETESGKHNDRQELKRAIARCRRAKAILIIAKLDRLARNVAFVANLMDSDIDFFACDYPNDDRFMLHIRAAIAEDEARRISERTKAALAAAKRRGVILGTDNLTRKGTLKGAATMKRLASERNADLVPTIKRLHARSQSLRAIAEEVGLACMTVSRILARNQ